MNAISHAARFVDQAFMQNRAHLRSSASLGAADALVSDLLEVWSECRHADWDGHLALPATWPGMASMYRFLQSMPIGFPRPTLGADPSGNFSAEWSRSPSRTVSVMIEPNDQLHFAAIIGSTETCGTEPFYEGRFPDEIRRLVTRAFS